MKYLNTVNSTVEPLSQQGRLDLYIQVLVTVFPFIAQHRETPFRAP